MIVNDDAGSRHLRDRAFALADSGLHDGWRTIEATLIGEGWPNAHRVLEHPHMRLSLNERCADARRAAAA